MISMVSPSASIYEIPPVASIRSTSTVQNDSLSAALQPDQLTISPAAQQALKTSPHVDDSGDGMK